MADGIDLDPLQMRTYLVDAYLGGFEDEQEWALIDNAKPDDLRFNLQHAIRSLVAARAERDRLQAELDVIDRRQHMSRPVKARVAWLRLEAANLVLRLQSREERLAAAGARAEEGFRRATAAEAEVERLGAERAEVMAVIREHLPEAIGLNTLPEIVAGLARQRDFQHEIKDHLAETAQRLTAERDAALARSGDQDD